MRKPSALHPRPQVQALFHGDVCPRNITATMDLHSPDCRLFHLVDFGASCSAALDDPSFRHKYCIHEARDVSREAIMVDPSFSSLSVLQSRLLLPFSDLESAVYTLVFLASGALPWAGGAEEPVAGGRIAV